MKLSERLGVFLALAAVLTAASLNASPLPQEQTRAAFTVTDGLGRQVRIPARVGRIISLEPEITRIIIALGGGDRLVALDYFLSRNDRIFPIIFPAGKRLPVVSNPSQDLNLEAALALRPDIVFTSPSESHSSAAIQEKLGVPVAALASKGEFAGLLKEIELVGRILGREERARELVGLFQARIDAVRAVTGKLPDSARPRVYLAFWGALDRTPVSYDPLDAAGGTNCAAGRLPAYVGTAGVTVPLEEIIRWNPDVVLIHGCYPPEERSVTVEGVLGDKRLSSIKAVRAKRVGYTFGFWYWWDPALVQVETLYLAHLLHPDDFPAFDLEKMGNEIYMECYGLDGAFSALSKVLKCDEWRFY